MQKKGGIMALNYIFSPEKCAFETRNPFWLEPPNGDELHPLALKYAPAPKSKRLADTFLGGQRSKMADFHLSIQIKASAEAPGLASMIDLESVFNSDYSL